MYLRDLRLVRQGFHRYSSQGNHVLGLYSFYLPVQVLLAVLELCGGYLPLLRLPTFYCGGIVAVFIGMIVLFVAGCGVLGCN